MDTVLLNYNTVSIILVSRHSTCIIYFTNKYIQKTYEYITNTNEDIIKKQLIIKPKARNHKASWWTGKKYIDCPRD